MSNSQKWFFSVFLAEGVFAHYFLFQSLLGIASIWQRCGTRISNTIGYCVSQARQHAITLTSCFMEIPAESNRSYSEKPWVL